MELPGEVGDELLGELHHVVVVAVRLVELEHRELGVVPRGQALVAEHPGDLEHPLEPADHEPLQVELGRDAQVEVEVERVVVRGERPGVGAARDRVEDRRLHLDEAAVLEPAPGEAEDAAAGEERGAALGVGPQVDVALAVAGVDVGDAVPLVAEAAPGLGEHRPRRDLDRQLALLGLHDLAGGADPVAEADLAEPLEVVGDRGQREQLDLGAARRRAAWRRPSLPWARCSITRPATATSMPVSSPSARARRARRAAPPTRRGRPRSGTGRRHVRVLLVDEAQAVQREPRLDVVDGWPTAGRSGPTGRRWRRRWPRRRARPGCARTCRRPALV